MTQYVDVQGTVVQVPLTAVYVVCSMSSISTSSNLIYSRTSDNCVRIPCHGSTNSILARIFNGHTLEGEGKSFVDWIEHLELIAQACRWKDQVKLVNLAARKQGQVYSFYHSCIPSQHGNYSSLVGTLKERFTYLYSYSVSPEQQISSRVYFALPTIVFPSIMLNILLKHQPNFTQQLRIQLMTKEHYNNYTQYNSYTWWF